MIHLHRAFFLSFLSLASFPFLLLLSLRCVALDTRGSCGVGIPCARDSADVRYLTTLTLTLRRAYSASVRMGVGVRGADLSPAFIFLSFFEDTISLPGLGAMVSYRRGKGSSPRRAHVHPSHTFPLMVLLVHRIIHICRSVLLVPTCLPSLESLNQSAFLSPYPRTRARSR
ncbi:hypothetical protein K438DRAFT_1816164 [Mycena galopus ATCC 62051]|nr:hypothetical protein K438DRAFT_1816164 [Mycena galopus ATCC 62051]